MSPRPSIICPRCGRQNLSRARYCSQCGLNLVAAGADEVTQTIRRNGRHAGTGLIMFLILLALFLAAMSSLVRVGSGRMCPFERAPRRILTPQYRHYPEPLDRPVERETRTDRCPEWQAGR